MGRFSRQSDNESDFIQMVETIMAGLMQDGIRLGANKNRGFGKLEVVYRTFANNVQKVAEVYKKEFTKQNISEWLDFTKENFLQELEDEQIAKSVLWNIDFTQTEESYITIRVPLQQKGGISIRTYSVVPGQADYEYLKFGNHAIIPGTSWAGAIRTRSKEILQTLLKDETLVNTYLNTWFGFVEETNACQSSVIFSESMIENGIPLQMTRNSINRFTGSSLEGGLYTEKSYFNGKLVLEMKVRKNYYERKTNNEICCTCENVTKADYDSVSYSYKARNGVVCFDKICFVLFCS